MERDGIGRSKVRSLADSSLIINHQSSMCDVRVCSKVDNASDFYSFFLQNEKRSFVFFLKTLVIILNKQRLLLLLLFLLLLLLLFLNLAREDDCDDEDAHHRCSG